MQFGGETIAIIGQPERVTRRRLEVLLHREGASVTRTVTRKTTAVVIGHGALSLLKQGDLERTFAAVAERNLTVFSEHAILRRLGILAMLQSGPRTHTLRELAASASLSPAVAKLLTLFDVIEDEDGLYSFRDVKAARDVARRLRQSEDLAATIETALDTRRRYGFQRHLAETSFVQPSSDMQLPLDLGDLHMSFETLWSVGEEAENSHDDEAAETAFRSCAAMRPKDALCWFKLASVLIRQENTDEARTLLRRALALKPDFSQAWHGLARLADDDAKAIEYLERAVAADPECIEALHELAEVRTNANDYEQAIPLWDRYLACASTTGSSDRKTLDRARRLLLLCRMARVKARAQAASS